MSSKDSEIKLLLKEIHQGKTLKISIFQFLKVNFLPLGKAKYEQLVEVRLALEMEINTYRSILEDEEKRIRKWALKEDHGDDDAYGVNNHDGEDDHKDDNADGDMNDDDDDGEEKGEREDE